MALTLVFSVPKGTATTGKPESRRRYHFLNLNSCSKTLPNMTSPLSFCGDHSSVLIWWRRKPHGFSRSQGQLWPSAALLAQQWQAWRARVLVRRPNTARGLGGAPRRRHKTPGGHCPRSPRASSDYKHGHHIEAKDSMPTIMAPAASVQCFWDYRVTWHLWLRELFFPCGDAALFSGKQDNASKILGLFLPTEQIRCYCYCFHDHWIPCW